MKAFFKLLNKSEWYAVLACLVLGVLIWLNDIGYGAIAFVPLMLLDGWLIIKAYEGEEKPSE